MDTYLPGSVAEPVVSYICQTELTWYARDCMSCVQVGTLASSAIYQCRLGHHRHHRTEGQYFLVYTYVTYICTSVRQQVKRSVKRTDLEYLLSQPVQTNSEIAAIFSLACPP
jgi:hypothetical protein